MANLPACAVWIYRFVFLYGIVWNLVHFASNSDPKCGSVVVPASKHQSTNMGRVEIGRIYSICLLSWSVHCNENIIYVFLFWQLRGLSSNFHIHVPVSDLYIHRIGPHIFVQQNRRPIWEYINRSQTQCLFWEYLFRIFGIASLQCTPQLCTCW